MDQPSSKMTTKTTRMAAIIEPPDPSGQAVLV